jgi:hypothetical protein
MTQSEIRDRLLELARVRLKARFGAFEQFRLTLDGLPAGALIMGRAALMPAAWTTGLTYGLEEAAKQIDAHLLRIIDEWAQREAPARQITALEGVQPLPAEPQAQAPQAAQVVGIDSNSTTPDPERRLALLRALGGNAIYKRGEWKITGISALVASEKSEGRKRSDEKTIRADLKEAAENERDAKRANAFAGLGQR